VVICAAVVSPWILCGPGFPPLSTGDSAGSTATVFMDGFTDFRYCGRMEIVGACRKGDNSQSIKIHRSMLQLMLPVNRPMETHLRRPGQGASGAHSAHEYVNLSVRLEPDLRPGRFAGVETMSSKLRPC